MNISNNEWKIMQLLWEKEPRTITEITKELGGEVGFKKSSIITYLKRLEEKCAIKYVQKNRAKEFYPIIKKEEAELEEVNGILKKVFGGNAGLLVNKMVKDNMLTEAEEKELLELLRGEKND